MTAKGLAKKQIGVILNKKSREKWGQTKAKKD